MSEYLETTAEKPMPPLKLTADVAVLIQRVRQRSLEVESITGVRTKFVKQLKGLLEIDLGREAVEGLFRDADGEIIDERYSKMLAEREREADGEPTVIEPGFAGMSLEQRQAWGLANRCAKSLGIPVASLDPKSLAGVFINGKCSAAEFVKMSTETRENIAPFVKSRGELPPHTFGDAQAISDKATDAAVAAQLQRTGFAR